MAFSLTKAAVTLGYTCPVEKPDGLSNAVMRDEMVMIADLGVRGGVELVGK